MITVDNAKSVLDPRYDRNIFVSAGHRGKGTGAVGLVDEAAEAIMLRDAVAALIGARAIKDDDVATLSAVVAAINAEATANDISLDIHFNASSNASANGVECYVGSAASARTKGIANRLCTELSACLSTRNRGVKYDNKSQHSRLAMCHLKCPSLLLEVCFVTNKNDIEMYLRKRDEVARIIAYILMRC